MCAIELLEAVLAPSESDTYEALVGFDDAGEPLCYACFGHTPMTLATYDLYWLATAPVERGRGFGLALMDALEQELRRRGVKTVRTETSSLEGKGGSVRFYEKAGYACAGRIPDFYRDGDDLIVMTKRLA